MNEVSNMAGAVLLVALVWLGFGAVWLADWTKAERIRRELHTIRNSDQESNQ